jgi:ssDNA-binding Zn-finger/Zn-ribbon topoisomerase 1
VTLAPQFGFGRDVTEGHPPRALDDALAQGQAGLTLPTSQMEGRYAVGKAGNPLWPTETSVPCPDCNVDLVIKRSRRGKFLACPRFPKCRGTLSLPSCTKASRTGKLCGKPMTEPVAGGKLSCKAHSGVRLKPPQRKKGEADAPPKKKAAKKKATRKPSAKKRRGKAAGAKKPTPNS